MMNHAACFALVFAALLPACSRPKPAMVKPGETNDTGPRTEAKPLRILIVDEPGWPQAIHNYWQVDHVTDLQFEAIDEAELLKRATDESLVSSTDVVLFPSRCLGTLVEHHQIVEHPQLLTDNQQFLENFAAQDIFSLIRKREITWGQKPYGMSLGSPVFVLVFRRDVFDELQLTPPETWTELGALTQRLQNGPTTAATDDEIWQAFLQPTAPSWAAQTLLARAAAYAGHRSYYSTLMDYRTLKPQIDQPPFTRALAEMIRDMRASSVQGKPLTPAEVERQFLSGNCAMAMTWPQAGPRDFESQVDPENIGFAQLPGSRDVYHWGDAVWTKRLRGEASHLPLIGMSGRMGAVVRRAQHSRAAWTLLTELSSTDVSSTVLATSPSTTMFRQSHQQRANRWCHPGYDSAAQEYASVVAQTLSQPMALNSPRLPGYRQYMAALDTGVREALAGNHDPSEALRQVATQWQERLDKIDAAAQSMAYQHSLGLDP